MQRFGFCASRKTGVRAGSAFRMVAKLPSALRRSSPIRRLCRAMFTQQIDQLNSMLQAFGGLLAQQQKHQQLIQHFPQTVWSGAKAGERPPKGTLTKQYFQRNLTNASSQFAGSGWDHCIFLELRCEEHLDRILTSTETGTHGVSPKIDRDGSGWC